MDIKQLDRPPYGEVHWAAAMMDFHDDGLHPVKILGRSKSPAVCKHPALVSDLLGTVQARLAVFRDPSKEIWIQNQSGQRHTQNTADSRGDLIQSSCFRQGKEAPRPRDPGQTLCTTYLVVDQVLETSYKVKLNNAAFDRSVMIWKCPCRSNELMNEKVKRSLCVHKDGTLKVWNVSHTRDEN
jgi:hypothetical protein